MEAKRWYNKNKQNYNSILILLNHYKIYLKNKLALSKSKADKTDNLNITLIIRISDNNNIRLLAW